MTRPIAFGLVGLLFLVYVILFVLWPLCAATIAKSFGLDEFGEPIWLTYSTYVRAVFLGAGALIILLSVHIKDT